MEELPEIDDMEYAALSDAISQFENTGHFDVPVGDKTAETVDEWLRHAEMWLSTQNPVSVLTFNNVVDTAMEDLRVHGVDLTDPGQLHAYAWASYVSFAASKAMFHGEHCDDHDHVIGHIARGSAVPAMIVLKARRGLTT